MTSHHRTSHLDVILTAGDPNSTGSPIEDTPFRILFLGDFSGRSLRDNFRSHPGFIDRRPLQIDRDNFDDVLRSLTPSIHSALLGNDSPSLALQLKQLDDFHPDSFLAHIEPIRQLYDIRRKLTNPATFHSGSLELATWMQPKPPSEQAGIMPPSPEFQPETTTAPPSNLLDTMVDEAQRSQAVTSKLKTSEWESYLGSIVSPYLVPDEDSRVSVLIGQIDDVLSILVRNVLHHPVWQSLEATWRGLKFLVDRLETDPQIQLHLLDVTKDELSADPCTGNDLPATGLYQQLVNRADSPPGESPWAVIGGAYSFDRSEMDVALLHQIAKIAHAAGTPFIAAGSPTIVGCHSFIKTPDPDDWNSLDGQQIDHERWNNLRKRPEATALSLALPRFLLRLPYGKDTEPIEAFPFEEIVGMHVHEQYLWGNPVFPCLLLLGQAFITGGWQMQPGSIKEIEGLPLHVYQAESGKSVTTPCAEVWLSDGAIERLLDEGLMTLASFKDQDRIHLMRFQSLAYPPTSIMGRWKTS